MEELEELTVREGWSGFVTYAKLLNVHETSKKRKNPMPGTTPIHKLLLRHVSDIGHFITNLASMTSRSTLPQVFCDASVLGIDKPG